MTSNKPIAFAADHAGYAYKDMLKSYIESLGYETLDLGTLSEDRVDYPDFGKKAAEAIASGDVDFGVIVCGSGIGISIAANREPAVRAALCHNAYTTEMARKHNDANILALGARVIDEATAKECVRIFLSTAFEGGRHSDRVVKLSC